MCKCDFCEKPCGNSWCPAIKEKVKKEEEKDESTTRDNQPTKLD